MVQEPAMPSEDFAYMLQEGPAPTPSSATATACTATHGHGEGPCMLHNPSYDFNDALLPLGATYWVELVREWLGQPRP
jgi:metal-dependent amidase/aminoacylase/carboxypeptidase family protein